MEFNKNLIAVLFVFLFVGIVSATPDQPTLNNPADDSTGVSTSPVLNFSVSNGWLSSNMNVTLYSVTTNKVLNNWFDVASGTDLNYKWWSLKKGVTYEWYVNATDDGGTTQGDTWSFTTDDSSNVTDCVEINSAGNYDLVNDIDSNTSKCIVIKSDDVNLNCNGHLINNSYSGNNQALVIEGSNNFSLNNCNISNFNYAVNVSNSNDSVFYNNNLTDNDYGVYFSSVVKNVNISNNKVKSNIKDISSKDVNSNEGVLILNNAFIENNYFSSNSYNHAYLIYASLENSSIKNNEFNNAYTGIDFIGQNVTIENNNINNIYKRGIMIDFLNMYPEETRKGDNLIKNNLISNGNKGANSYGIYLSYASRNIIEDNNISSCNAGVFYDASYHNLIYNNNIFNNTAGLQMSGSLADIGANNFSSNHIYDNTYGILNKNDVIGNNTYEFNNITDNDYGYVASTLTYDYYYKNLISNNGYGVWVKNLGNGGGVTSAGGNNQVMSYAHYNNWVENNIVSNNIGVYVEDNSLYAFINNTINSNNYGVVILNTGSIFENNLLNSNNYGFYVYGVKGVVLGNNKIVYSHDWDFYSESGSGVTANDLIFTNTVASFKTSDVSINYVSNPPEDPENYSNGQAFIKVLNNSANVWVDLNLSYDASLVHDENKLSMWQYDSSWVKLGGNINKVKNYVNYNVTNFSIFGLFEDIRLYVCPVPNEPNDLSIYGTAPSGSCCVNNATIRYYWSIGNTNYTKDVVAPSGCLNVTGGVKAYAVKNNPEWLKWLIIFFVFLVIYFVYMW